VRDTTVPLERYISQQYVPEYGDDVIQTEVTSPARSKTFATASLRVPKAASLERWIQLFRVLSSIQAESVMTENGINIDY
jgi:hypothetical protein